MFRELQPLSARSYSESNMAAKYEGKSEVYLSGCISVTEFAIIMRLKDEMSPALGIYVYRPLVLELLASTSFRNI